MGFSCISSILVKCSFFKLKYKNYLIFVTYATDNLFRKIKFFNKIQNSDVPVRYTFCRFQFSWEIMDVSSSSSTATSSSSLPSTRPLSSPSIAVASSVGFWNLFFSNLETSAPNNRKM